MGYKLINLQMPTKYREVYLESRIRKMLGISKFKWTIENKALDARKKDKIHWQMRLLVNSPELKGDKPELKPELQIPYRKRNKKAVVVGSGPAGFFAAFVLQKAGFQTTLIERGSEVGRRSKSIETFEKTGRFDAVANYAFGEGGAGTFSDGKLTSRSKRISLEKRFILQTYVNAGAPEEIKYLTHPHLGSDKLREIVKILRMQFQELGGTVLFETLVENFKAKQGRVSEIITNKGRFQADYFVFAIGHAAFETYRMLMKNGISFHTKNFALGSRMEHPQTLINKAQWGVSELQGVKAAEYRLTSQADKNHPVYTFCMCPGGTIVPATAYENQNIVNGMSLYQRDGKFSNAACVAGLNLNNLLGREVSALETLDWLESLESEFYQKAGGYAAPFCGIDDFINKRIPSRKPESSYPMGLLPAPLWEWLPESVSNAMRKGLKDFSRKMKGFEKGNIMGLESKTSAAIQVDRNEEGLCAGFENLYMTGEGSGYTGGIISSAADGVKAAMGIISKV